jgi:hypothetical protein
VEPQQIEEAERRQTPSDSLVQRIDECEMRVMAKPPPDRWLAVGGALTAVGAALGVGYWIYGMQASPHVSFWHLPGYMAVALFVLGIVALVVGFFGASGGPPPGIQQRQRGGRNSINIQAVGDMGREAEGDERG